MANVLYEVDRRTQIVGENRLELLLFRLHGPQLYGINVFKVQEVIRCPKLTHIPNSKDIVVGIANMRGKTIPVIDLSLALGRPPIQDQSSAYIIIADYYRSVQGFMVTGVDRIVNMNWEEILPPPKGSGGAHYLTAVTNVDDKIVEIIDLEKVLHDITGIDVEVSKQVASNIEENISRVKTVLVVMIRQLLANILNAHWIRLVWSVCWLKTEKKRWNIWRTWHKKVATCRISFLW